MELGIVIPCYNEFERLAHSDFESFLDQRQNISLLFVNDGSNDETITILKKLNQSKSNRIDIINLKKNEGKAFAVKTGMNFFLEKKKFDKIAFLDADLSTSLEECYALSKKVNSKIKFVFGSRIRKIDNNINRLYHRFIIGRILATFISRILNLPIYDSQCGCKIFNSELIPVAFNDHFLTKWLFDVEIFFRLKNHFGSENLIAFSKETPLKSWKDMGGSKIRLSYGFWVWFDLIKIYRFYK